MNYVTGPMDMFFNHGGWREFLMNSWPLLVGSAVVVVAIIYFGLKHVQRGKDE